MTKCWLRVADDGRENGDGWSSGAKTCAPPDTTELIMGNQECWVDGKKVLTMCFPLQLDNFCCSDVQIVFTSFMRDLIEYTLCLQASTTTPAATRSSVRTAIHNAGTVCSTTIDAASRATSSKLQVKMTVICFHLIYVLNYLIVELIMRLI